MTAEAMLIEALSTENAALRDALADIAADLVLAQIARDRAYREWHRLYLELRGRQSVGEAA